MITPEEARAAILAGKTVKMVVGPDPEDPVLLHYLDTRYENYGVPMIYTEAIGGWSEGITEAICERDSDFYVRFINDPEPPLSLEITDEEPLYRENYKGS